MLTPPAGDSRRRFAGRGAASRAARTAPGLPLPFSVRRAVLKKPGAVRAFSAGSGVEEVSGAAAGWPVGPETGLVKGKGHGVLRTVPPAPPVADGVPDPCPAGAPVPGDRGRGGVVVLVTRRRAGPRPQRRAAGGHAPGRPG